MKVAFTFSSFTYSGWSIGRDIRVEIAVAGKASVYERRMHPLYFIRPDIPLGIIDVEEEQQIHVIIKVTEKDEAYPDKGEVETVVTIPSFSALPNIYTTTLEVSERRFIFWKVSAKFTIDIEVRAIPQELPALKQYSSYRGEDYNRYDGIINEAVSYWNDQFARDANPPNEPLDPNLVKAMTYQESRVGNDPKHNGLINIMQVGNEGDLSLEVLRGDETEYWIHDGKKIKLKYLDAEVKTVYDSVFWGVRWLYHKAHRNIQNEDGRWENGWRTWKEAVERYGSEEPEYLDNIWRVYKEGVSDRDGGVKLWSFVGFFWLVLLPFFGIGVSDAYLGRSYEEYVPYLRAEYRDGIDIIRSPDNSSLFAAAENDGEDWSESFAVGRIKNGSIVWIPEIDDKNDPIFGVISLRFLKLQGFNEPVLEVWRIAHRGYGFLDLYRVTANELISVARIKAVDKYIEGSPREDYFSQYSEEYDTCGIVYEGDRLNAEYEDRNGDGVSDVVLSGTEIVYCEKLVGFDDEGYVLSQTDELERRPVVDQVHYLEPN